MTAIFYPDCTATSPDGRFTLEAQSPHNGTIRHRDGREPSEDEYGFKYREHQHEFRYRLLDHGPRSPAPRVVWERWQAKREDSPHELVVADDGWAVLRTHGFVPEVIAVNPEGRDVVRARVVSADVEPPKPDLARHPPAYDWPLARLTFSTAGNRWAGDSWRFFLSYAGAPYFSWRTGWGERLVLDLGRGVAYMQERDTPPDLLRAVVEEEQRQVAGFLARMTAQLGRLRAHLKGRATGDEDDSLADDADRVRAALHLVGVYRLRECLPYLREWEAIDCPSHFSSLTAMPRHWSMEYQLYRPVVHHALKRLGEEPLGLPAYRFAVGEFGKSRERVRTPKRVPGRRERAAAVRPGMAGVDVLRQVGTPDFVRQWFKGDMHARHWSEAWEYDFRDGGTWTTLRLTWEQDGPACRLTTIEEVPPDWLDSSERIAEYLRP